jgi:3-deoxy-alpha-D-manno-octulosonate 8-oxidase
VEALPNDPIAPASSITQSLVPEVIMASGHGAEICVNKVEEARITCAPQDQASPAVFLIDNFFDVEAQAVELGAKDGDFIAPVLTHNEPSTESVDTLAAQVRNFSSQQPAVVVGFGGGTVMDSAKAVSNLLTNPGKAEQYQGWDLLDHPGVAKIGIPTISGTGAEASRTCVITNPKTGAKLGMNSRHSIFDIVILDPTYSESVPRDQFFFTGMDTYMHNIESLNGRFRNSFADALARESLSLIKTVFRSSDMTSFDNRSRLMTASCLGGMAIAGTYVGLIHPMSAALSVVFGTHHGVANCIVMRAMQPFYPEEFDEFWQFADQQKIEVPTIRGHALTDHQLESLIAATLIHERPLSNALGLNYREILGGHRLRELFSML